MPGVVGTAPDPVSGPFGLAWRTLVLVTAAVVPFAVVAQVSWLNLELIGPRRWLVVKVRKDLL